MPPRTLTTLFVLLAGSASVTWAETAVPAAAAPIVDGQVEDAEWAGATRLELTPEGDVFLKHHDGDLYVGIRSSVPAIAGIALYANERVIILHTSASLGSARYEKQKDTWGLVRGFEWACREGRGAPASAESHAKHVETASWDASTISMGRPGETEFRIGSELLGDQPARLAALSLDMKSMARSGGEAAFWPATVSDDARSRDLLMGKTPPTLDLTPQGWADAALRAAPAEVTLLPGKIQEIACDADASQRYSCYVPSTYDAARAAPILYCFSPAARGEWFVQHLRDECEKRGWLLVGSLSWKSGMQSESDACVDALLQDTRARFNLAPAREYVCGFADGGLVAFDVAARHPGRIAGVIAIGVATDGESRPEAKLAVGLICGSKDPAYAGVKKLRAALTKAGNPVRTFTHSDGHTKPGDALLAKAVAWIDDRAKESASR